MRPDTLRGLTRVATIIDSLRRVSRLQPVVVDAGDIIQGNPLAFVAARIDSTMPQSGHRGDERDATTTRPPSATTSSTTALPYLDAAARRPSSRCSPRTCIRPTARRAFAAGRCRRGCGDSRSRSSARRRPARWSGTATTSPAGSSFATSFPTVRAAVRDARGAGADVVIVVAALRARRAVELRHRRDRRSPSENVAARVAREVPGIDLIVYGHSHKEMADTVIGRHAAHAAEELGDRASPSRISGSSAATGAFACLASEAQIVQARGHTENAQVLAATQEGHRAAVAYATTPIGSTSQALARRFGARRRYAAHRLHSRGRSEGDRRAARVDGRVHRSTRRSAPGPITVARLAALYPYDNTLRAVRITGAQLRAYLEQSARYFRTSADGAYGTDPQIPGYNYDIVSGVDYTIDLAAGRRAHHEARISGDAGRADRHLHDGAQQLSADRRRRLLDAARRAGRLRPAAGDPAAADRRSRARAARSQPSDYFQRNWRTASRGGDCAAARS